MASAVRRDACRRIVPGALLRDVCAWAEDEIRRRGAHPAFPVQTSLNEVAAHYCPADGEATVYREGDLAKLDLGVHVDGWVVDTAATVDVGGGGANRHLVLGAEAALQKALGIAATGVPVRALSAAIEREIASRGLRGLRNLCGHGVGRWVVHGPPPVPNVVMDQADELRPGTAIAIEPFVTEGLGLVVERGVAEVFRLDPQKNGLSGIDPGIVDALRAFRGLPFARHQVEGFAEPEVRAAIEALRSRRAIASYPPLVETTGHPVAQAEHTIWVGEGGIEVLTL